MDSWGYPKESTVQVAANPETAEAIAELAALPADQLQALLSGPGKRLIKVGTDWIDPGAVVAVEDMGEDSSAVHFLGGQRVVILMAPDAFVARMSDPLGTV